MGAIITTLAIGVGTAWLAWYIVCTPITAIIEALKELRQCHKLSFTSIIVLILETVLSTVVILTAARVILSLL